MSKRTARINKELGQLGGRITWKGICSPSPVHAPSPSFICPLLHLENSEKYVALLAWLSATPRDLLGMGTQRAQADADALGGGIWDGVAGA